MDDQVTAGKRFRVALADERPLQIMGAVNAYCSLLAERVGYRAIYLSGAGVSNASYGIPDLGMTNLTDILTDVRRITSATSVPLIVDVDTGWGDAFNVARAVREMMAAGAAGIHIEDQVLQKRCGHRPNKEIIPTQEMIDRIKAATDARGDPDFFIMARTDALQSEDFDSAVERVLGCVEAGADGVFPEAVQTLGEYRAFSEAMGEVPVLANITEFGATPLFSRGELREAGVSMILYPLSAFRAMSNAATQVYEAIRRDGHQANVLERMQTRDELYDVLRYHEHEQKLDQLADRQEDPTT